MSRVFWVDTAEQARDTALEFIARQSLDSALAQFDEIERQTDRLVRHPYLGRPGKTPGTRDLTINRTYFVVTYRIVGDNIQVLRFRHTSQKR